MFRNIFLSGKATSGFNSAGTWLAGNPPSVANGYFTRTFALRSPADTGTYTFAGAALSIDLGGRFIMKGPARRP